MRRTFWRQVLTIVRSSMTHAVKIKELITHMAMMSITLFNKDFSLVEKELLYEIMNRLDMAKPKYHALKFEIDQRNIHVYLFVKIIAIFTNELLNFEVS